MKYKSMLCFWWGIALALRGFSAQPQPGTLLWSYDLGDAIISSPALARDGTIYLGASSGLYAITNNASIASNKWSFLHGMNNSPAIGTDGTIYFGVGPAFYAVNPDGSQKWSLALPNSDYVSTPAIGSDGKIYFVAGGQLHAVNPFGAHQWAFQIEQSQRGGAVGPVIGPEGTIYVGSTDSRRFFAINPDGTQRWMSGLGDACFGAAAIGADGTIYVPAFGVYALSPTGDGVWTNLSTGNAAAVIGNDGTIYVGAVDLSLTAISSSGQTKWKAVQYGVRARPTTPAIDSAGMIYYCVSNSVFAVTPEGNVQWVFQSEYPPTRPPYEDTTAPVIGPDGTIYAAVYRTLYAIANTNGPGNPWPMFNQNARHTGKVERPQVRNPRRADAFQFDVYGQVGESYRIETSPDLGTWTTLTSFVYSAFPFTFVDDASPELPNRFYRAVSP